MLNDVINARSGYKGQITKGLNKLYKVMLHACLVNFHFKLNGSSHDTIRISLSYGEDQVKVDKKSSTWDNSSAGILSA